jgi:hypothetical protein
MPQNIFALVIEIHHIAGLAISKGVPVIALCNFDSPQNWVSQGLVEYLSSKITKRPTSHPHLEHDLIKVSWSCERLGQYNQEGTFIVEPKAKFTIVFGCAQFKPCSPVVSTSRSFPVITPARVSRPGRSKTEPVLPNATVQEFREGLENRTLLRLRRVPSVVLDQTLNETVEELEETLDLIYTTDTFVDQALTTSDIQNTNSHITQLKDLIPTIRKRTIHSSCNSVATELSESTNDQSTNTSISTDGPQYKRVTRQIPLGFNTDTTLNARWFCCSQIPESKYENSSASVSGSITPRTDTLQERAQKLLDEVSLVADLEANEYWTWDEEACRFKHFDHGSEVPVWYSPPVT